MAEKPCVAAGLLGSINGSAVANVVTTGSFTIPLMKKTGYSAEFSGAQYSTFNFKVYMSSLTRWEHTQVETRLLLDNIMRGDAEAASLICSNHFNAVL